MAKINQTIILENAAKLYPLNGTTHFTIRNLAKEISISPSVIYHYFEDESTLLKAMFNYLNISLGEKRALLPKMKHAKDMMKQRIEFQLENADAIVAVFKYYLDNRANFPKNKVGFLPDKSTIHIEEVLQFGLDTKEFSVGNLKDEAKVITHAINGFLLEYYPYKLIGKEKKQVIHKINTFLMKALKGGENI